MSQNVIVRALEKEKLTEAIITRKAVNTVMLTTFGTSGVHAVGLVTNSFSCECLFK